MIDLSNPHLSKFFFPLVLCLVNFMIMTIAGDDECPIVVQGSFSQALGSAAKPVGHISAGRSFPVRKSFVKQEISTKACFDKSVVLGLFN